MDKCSISKSLFMMLLPVLISCQKEYYLGPSPSVISSLIKTRSAYESVNLDSCSRFDISDALVRHYIEASEKSAVIRSIEPYEIDGQPCLFVVNLEKGWRIISADARTKAVLAKGESGSFDLSVGNNANVRLWLNDIAEQISTVKHSDITEVDNSWKQIGRFKRHMRVPTDTSHRSLPSNTDSVWIVLLQSSDTTEITYLDIPHLLETKWGQWYPWNIFLHNYGSGYYPTGPVPTAVAQILYYYHHYLGRPSGLYHSISIDYMNPYYIQQVNPETGGPVDTEIGRTTVVSRSDYQESSTHWNSMPLDIQSAFSNPTGTSYVAELMVDIGNRLFTVYGNDRADVLIYPGIPYVYLSGCNIEYDYAEYDDSIRDSIFCNLLNSQPVLVTAAGTDGDHAWVIDGGYHKETTIQNNVSYRYVPYVENIEEEYSNAPLEVVIDWFVSLQDLNLFYPNAPKRRDRVISFYHERYFRMNWGNYGANDDGLYSCSPYDSWGSSLQDRDVYYNLIPSYSFAVPE